MRIELNELGAGQHIELRDPKKLSWGAQKEIVNSMDDTNSSNLDVAEKLFLALAKGGYLLDVDDKPVSFPVTSDVILLIPALAIERVTAEYSKTRENVTSKN